MKQPEFDIIVIGAGVAGGVFAASQSKDKRILVVERDLTEQERIVGELMQPGGVEALKKLNLAHLIEGIDAQEVLGYQIIHQNKSFAIDYNEVQTGVTGMGLRNGKFLSTIRKELNQLENVTLIQGNVIDLIEKDGSIVGIKYTDENNQEVLQYAKLTVVSDGPMSLLRNRLGNANKEVKSYFMGLILENLNLEVSSYGHLIITGKYPILVYPVYSNAYRILIDYPGNKPPRIGIKLKEQLLIELKDALPTEMFTSFEDAIANQELKVMPNHSLQCEASRMKGAVLLGDSLNMRHPLTGGGMTAAFYDIICLNDKLQKYDINQANQLENAIKNYYTNRVHQVETINILANALYQIVINDDLKMAFFEYLQKGGEHSKGPLSILSGLNTDKKYLLKHFFKVVLQHPMHFFTKPKKQISMYVNATKIIRPILKKL